jgi:2'-hydroxyisoflavone reductase
MELPLWLPEEEAAILQADVSRAVASDLAFRPLEKTVRDTLEWANAGGDAGPLASGLEMGEAGMRPEREAELLKAWRARA